MKKFLYSLGLFVNIGALILCYEYFNPFTRGADFGFEIGMPITIGVWVLFGIVLFIYNLGKND